MRIAVALFVCLVGTATAYAQAPGEYVIAAPPAVGYHDVMADRWSVGFGIGSVSLHAPQTDPTGYGIGELALRFRLTPHVELESTFGAGDSSDKSTSVGLATLGVRYIFQPRADWNVWVMGALGVLDVTMDPQASSSTPIERSMAQLGMGIERRFAHFALQAEARAIGASAPKAANDAARADATSTMTPAMATDTLSGGELTLGASYYF
jgi:hypothetical protein